MARRKKKRCFGSVDALTECEQIAKAANIKSDRFVEICVRTKKKNKALPEYR